MIVVSLSADIQGVQDTAYTCIAFEKTSNNKTTRLDMNQSLKQGGDYSFGMRINFLDAIITKNEDTINNVKFQNIRFAFRTDINGYALYIHDYNKDYFTIKKDYPKAPVLIMTLKNKDKIRYQCLKYTDTKGN